MPDNVFDSVLGQDYLPPSPLLPIRQLLDANAPAAVATAPNGATGGDPGTGGLNVPVGPQSPVPPPAQAAPPTPSGQPGAWGNLPPQLAGLIGSAIQPQGGVLGANTGRFFSALGAGLSSAGQNWNKPAMAAFAGGAGAALQGGQHYEQQQQDAKLKALHAAIAAWKIGDMATYHRSLAAYHQAIAQQRQRQAAPAPPPPQPAPEEAAERAAQAGQVPPEATATAAATPEAARAGDAQETVADAQSAAPPAEPDPAQIAAHRMTLARFLTAAGAPPERVDPADVHAAARLMATKALAPAHAFETAAIHGALAHGHASPAEIDLIYGPGAADAIRSAAAS